MADLKGWLQLLGTAATTIVAGLWAYVGYEYKQSMDTFTNNAKRFEIVSGLLKECASGTETTAKEAQREISSIAAYAATETATASTIVSSVFGDRSSLRALQDECVNIFSASRSIPQAGQQTIAVTKSEIETADAISPPTPSVRASNVTPSAPPNEGKLFWIYIGNYKDNKWQNKYLNVPDDFDPAKFGVLADSKRVYKLNPRLKSLNVRFGEFSASGDFPPITNRPITADQEIKLRSTAQWFDTGDWWATIEPPK